MISAHVLTLLALSLSSGVFTTTAPSASSTSADLDKVPTLAEVEDALGAVVVNTPEERERANRVKTWAEILRK